MSKHSEVKTTPIVADGMTLGVIGAGVMGQTLLRGLIASGVISQGPAVGRRQEPVPLRSRRRRWAFPSRPISSAACPTPT